MLELKVFYSYLLPGDYSACKRINTLNKSIESNSKQHWGSFSYGLHTDRRWETLCTYGILIRSVLIQDKVQWDPILYLFLLTLRMQFKIQL